VHPAPIVTPHAPASSTAEPSPTIERHVGELVAAAAGAIAEGLRERQTGGLTAATKRHGGDLICELYQLRQYMVGYWDFDVIAREYGKAALCGTGVDAKTIDLLVDEVLAILGKVVRAAAN
jgi:hypothetical protein